MATKLRKQLEGLSWQQELCPCSKHPARSLVCNRGSHLELEQEKQRPLKAMLSADPSTCFSTSGPAEAPWAQPVIGCSSKGEAAQKLIGLLLGILSCSETSKES